MALTTNLVSYYKFDENAGTTVGDSQGSNTGTTHGANPWTASGKINAGGLFDGSTNYVSVPDNASLDFTAAVTIAAWVYFTTVNTNNQIVSKRSSFGATGIPYELTSTGSPNVNFSWRVIGNTSILTGITNISANTWYYVVGTWDGTNTVLYVNNSVDASGTHAGTITANATAIGIGQLPAGSGEPFTGRIDEVAIWSRALSSPEVSQLYNGGVGLQYPFTSSATKVGSLLRMF